MAVLVTGGAGFIGAGLLQELLALHKAAFVLDNCCRGSWANLRAISPGQSLETAEVDLHDLAEYRKSIARLSRLQPITEVWHLAANSDIPAGVADPDLDFRDTFLTTFNTLKIMEEFGIKRILFASSSAVYGDRKGMVLTEETGPLLPISNYGAMKLASEAAISAAAERFLEHAAIFRFPNVVGVPATHGVILDFITRLQADPTHLRVLGNGTQQKSYLHVRDLLSAMFWIREHAEEKVALFNIGPADSGVTVRQIAEAVVSQVALGAKISYGNEDRGWIGDVPRFFYSTEKLRRLGWQPRMDSLGAIRQAAAEIAQQVGSVNQLVCD